MSEEIISDKVAFPLIRIFQSLYESRQYSDLTITCDKAVHMVHRAVVCPQSEFFARACRENAWKEGDSRTVELYKGDDRAAEEHADLVLLMVHFFYNMNYPEPDEPTDKLSPHESFTNESPKDKDELLRNDYVEGWDGPRLKKNATARLASRRLTVYCSPSSVILHSRMYALGDYYGIDGLKDCALAKFSTAAKLHFTCNEFAEAIYIVYTSTVPQDRGLRDVVTDVFENNPDLLQNPEIEATGREIPDLAWDVAKAMYRRYTTQRQKSIIFD